MSPWSSKGLHMFDLDQFVADCRSARGTDCPSKTIGEVIKRTVSDPAGLLKVLGEPDRAGIKELYRASDLSILNVVWAPGMMVMPHNHRMWANIGVYVGREDNIFWASYRKARGNADRSCSAPARWARKTRSRSAKTLSTRSSTRHPNSLPRSTFTAAISLPPSAVNGTQRHL